MERKITIEETAMYEEDYQMMMLKIHPLKHILTVTGRGIDEKSCYDYDVTGKISMKAMYERGTINAKDMILFLEQFILAQKELEKYLLNVNCLLLEPDYIFYEEEQFYFCYYPLSKKTIWEEFHKLTEYLVKKADYQNQECVQMVFALHKGVMEENYSIDKLVKECRGILKEHEEELNQLKKEEQVYDLSEHDWIAEQSEASSILRETDNLWTPVKRFLNKHKKSKWGDWDGLHIEEEDL